MLEAGVEHKDVLARPSKRQSVTLVWAQIAPPRLFSSLNVIKR